MRKKYFIILFSLITACAIRKNLETPFLNPENKPALDVGGDGDPAHGTKFCSPEEDGTFNAKDIKLEFGTNGIDGSGWAIGGGCVLRPIREVWAVLNNLSVMKFEDADTFHSTRMKNIKAEFSHAYEITYSVSTVKGDVDWTMRWYHGIGGGSFAEPKSINVNYQRTKGDSSISIWRGGIVLTKVNDDVTAIGVRNEFKALQTKAKNVNSAIDALNEFIEHTRTGDPDWDALNGTKKNDAPAVVAPVKPKQEDAPTNAENEYDLKIECVVEDPQTLEEIFDLKKDDKIQANGKGDKTTMTINGKEGLPDFPSPLVLDEKSSAFKVDGIVKRNGGTLHFQMTGTIGGKGSVLFTFDSDKEGGTKMDGSAQLKKCQLIKKLDRTASPASE
jgi:hypothetical protein